MTSPAPLEPGQYYHIYNRGNNRENLFVEERNYRYYLELYAKHIEPAAETFAYCLLPNHFHLLVWMKDLGQDEDLGSLRGNLTGRKRPSQSFSNLCNAYTKAFNKVYGRSGALFQRPFGRVQVTSDAYLAHLVTYIHFNPERHGLVDDFRAWPYSSYRAYLSAQPTRLRREEVLGWFGGPEGFEMAHRVATDPGLVAMLAPDDP
jgi:REP element-mobilizing transposase RayT